MMWNHGDIGILRAGVREIAAGLGQKELETRRAIKKFSDDGDAVDSLSA